MSVLVIASTFLFSLSAQDANFSEFAFCREIPGRGEVSECVRVDAEGRGSFTLREDGEEFVDPLELAEPAMAELAGLLEETGYLRDASEYESQSDRVADTGQKTLTVEGTWGRREAVFNYSSRNEIISLMSYLDRLISQEHLRLDLDAALTFDRLGLPALLERVDAELRLGRLVDPTRLVEVLDRIASDSRVLNIARTDAGDLIEKIRED
jgi:hypothetical protein